MYMTQMHSDCGPDDDDPFADDDSDLFDSDPDATDLADNLHPVEVVDVLAPPTWDGQERAGRVERLAKWGE